jgi:ketosteroid isomerase-like protein
MLIADAAQAVGDRPVEVGRPMNTPAQAISYEIRVKGALDARWSAWFAGLDVASDPTGETTLSGPLADQAALHGLLARVRDLGLPLIAVRRLDADPRDAGGLDAQMDPRERRPLMIQDQILALGQRWADAEQRGDSAALDTLMTDDFVAVGPRGFVLNRQQWLDRYRSGALKIEAFSWEDVSVREYGTAAIALGIVAQFASYQGQDASGRFRVTQIAVQKAGRWLCAGVQYSGPIPDVPPMQA